MDVLFTHSYFYKMDAKQWRNQTPFPPLSTIYAASYLRNNNYSVSLFDVGLKENPQQLSSILKKEKPQFFVIYDDGFNYLTKMCLTTMRNACFEMIKMGKSQGCKVIISSSDSTDHAEDYLNQGADFIIYGEGEETLLKLVESLSKKYTDTSLLNIDGVIFRNAETNAIEKTKQRTVLKNLDELPLPAWDLIDIESYQKIWKNSNQEFTLNLATTRGCPYHCNWCAKPIYGQRYNSHSPKRIVEMISHLSKEYQVNRFWMCDDIFGLKPNWVQEFNKELKKYSLNISYYIQSRADLLLKENTVEALAESGCSEIWIGAESGSQKILDAMDKGITVEQIEKSTKLLQAKNIGIAFFIQYGYLNETKKDIEKTIDMIQKLKPDNIGVSVSYPLPDTPFYEKVKHQFTSKSNWTDSDDFALLFKGTFNENYYRKLQRYTHKVFRKSQGLNYLTKGKILNNLRSILLLAYYIPSVEIDKIRLNMIQNLKFNNN
ncbi:MAG: radical SAM protein [Flavobacteriaceae bacterium]|nr:MAG: radical SAM protein [Flavobacteriaceae bacterium]